MYAKLITLIFICIAVNLCEAELREGEPGVCVETVTTYVTKKCRLKKTCMESRHELQVVCCKGYEYFESKCRPYCKYGCRNGTCVAGKCQCDPPLVLERNRCVLPTCEPPCNNGRCVGRNVCECNAGLTFLNSTHCDCPARYSYVSNTCKPICDQPCSNGSCVEPNKCNCSSGFKNDPENKFNCLPICEPECVNGRCVSPNTCICNKKFETTGSGICKPQCIDCFNGECVAPDECRCHAGYSMSNGTCTPVCSKECTNGYCSEPDICVCQPGYKIKSSNKFVCEPVCSSGCVNATCSAPNECKCLPGYESTDDKSVCKPYCESCINGECVAPNKCRCDEGYKKNDTLPHLCYKPCEGLCENGICFLDGTCSCQQGYQYDAKNKTCTKMQEVACSTCNSTCLEMPCFCDDGVPCYESPTEPDEVTSSRLASMEMTWIFGAAVGFLLLILVVAVMMQIWRKRKNCESKAQDNVGELYSGAMFIAPHTLKNRSPSEDDYCDGINENQALKFEEEKRDERFLSIREFD